jgi:hypothetical protein
MRILLFRHNELPYTVTSCLLDRLKDKAIAAGHQVIDYSPIEPVSRSTDGGALLLRVSSLLDLLANSLPNDILLFSRLSPLIDIAYSYDQKRMLGLRLFAITASDPDEIAADWPTQNHLVSSLAAVKYLLQVRCIFTTVSAHQRLWDSNPYLKHPAPNSGLQVFRPVIKPVAEVYRQSIDTPVATDLQALDNSSLDYLIREAQDGTVVIGMIAGYWSPTEEWPISLAEAYPQVRWIAFSTDNEFHDLATNLFLVPATINPSLLFASVRLVIACGGTEPEVYHVMQALAGKLCRPLVPATASLYFGLIPPYYLYEVNTHGLPADRQQLLTVLSEALEAPVTSFGHQAANCTIEQASDQTVNHILSTITGISSCYNP